MARLLPQRLRKCAIQRIAREDVNKSAKTHYGDTRPNEKQSLDGNPHLARLLSECFQDHASLSWQRESASAVSRTFRPNSIHDPRSQLPSLELHAMLNACGGNCSRRKTVQPCDGDCPPSLTSRWQPRDLRLLIRTVKIRLTYYRPK